MATDTPMANIFEVCDVCGLDHNAEDCPELAAEPDRRATSLMSLAQMTIPKDFSLRIDDAGVPQIVTVRAIPAKTKLGPFESRRTTAAMDIGSGFVLRVFRADGGYVTLDSSNENECNWLSLVQTASSDAEQNLMVVQLGFDIFYTTTRTVHAGEYLKVWYAPHYAKKLGKPSQPDGGSTTTLLTLSRGTSLDGTPSTVSKHIETAACADQSTSQNPPCCSSAAPVSTTQMEVGHASQVMGAGDCSYLGDCHSSVIVMAVTGADSEKASATVSYNGGPLAVYGNVENTILQSSCTPTIAFKRHSRGRKKAARIGTVKAVKQAKHFWPCSLCSMTFTGPRGLGKHRKDLHRQPPPPLPSMENDCESHEVEKRRRSLSRSGGGRSHSIDSRHSSYSQGERGKVCRTPSSADYAAQGIKECVVHLLIEGPARDRALAELAKKAGRALMSNSDKAGQSSSDAGSASTGVSSYGRGKRRKLMPKRLLDSDVLADDADNTDDLTSEEEEEEEEIDATEHTSLPLVPQPRDSVADAAEGPPAAAASSSCSTRTTRCGKCQATFSRRKSLSLHRCPLPGPTGDELRAMARADLEACRRDDGTYSCPECCPTPSGAATTCCGGGGAAAAAATAAEVGVEGQTVVAAGAAVEVGVGAAAAAAAAVEVGAVVAAAGVAVEVGVAAAAAAAAAVEVGAVVAAAGAAVEVGVAAAAAAAAVEVGAVVAAAGAAVEVGVAAAAAAAVEVGAVVAAAGVGGGGGGGAAAGTITAARTFASVAELEQHMIGHSDHFLCDVCLRTVQIDVSLGGHCQKCTGPPGTAESAPSADESATLQLVDSATLRSLPGETAPNPKPGAAAQQPVLVGDGGIGGGHELPPGVEHPCAADLAASGGGCEAAGSGDAMQKNGVTVSCDRAPLGCDICDLTFASPVYLERHQRIHAGAYKCHKCGIHCSGSFPLLRHLVQCDRKRLAIILGSAFPPLACKDCSLPFASQVALSVHLAMHHSEQYLCRRCEMKFHSKVLFENHDCSDTAGEPTSCSMCRKTFYSKRKLRRHMYQHTLRFTCTICSRPYSRREDFVRHNMECNAARMLQEDGTIKCPSCSSTFKDLPTYKSHAELHTHVHKCSKCGRRFMRKINAVQHEKCCSKAQLVEDQPTAAAAAAVAEPEARGPEEGAATGAAGHDGGEAPAACASEWTSKGGRRVDDLFICYVCGRCYTSKSNLNKHIKTHGDRRFMCPVCSKKFHHYHTMRQHYDAVHTNLLNAQCPHCDKLFCTKYTMISHIKQFHSDKVETFACEHCGKVFRQKGNMRKHLLKHQGAHNYACAYCTKTFRYPEQHRRHQLMHTKGKTLACERCDRKFVLQHELRKHEREFHNTGVYVCPVCSEVCRWRHTVRRHIKRKHPGYTAQLDSAEFLASLVRDVNEVGAALHRHSTADHAMTTSADSVPNVDAAIGSQDAGMQLQQTLPALEGSQLSFIQSPAVEMSAPEALHGSTIHFYSDEGVNLTPESAGALRSALTRSLDNLASGANRTLVSINGQQFTITVTPQGQTLLTPDIVIPQVLAPAEGSELQGHAVQIVDATTACDLPASGNLTDAPA